MVLFTAQLGVNRVVDWLPPVRSTIRGGSYKGFALQRSGRRACVLGVGRSTPLVGVWGPPPIKIKRLFSPRFSPWGRPVEPRKRGKGW